MVVVKGEIQTVQFYPNENGGTRILKGTIVAGREGEELSWRLDGMVEVKVSIWTLPAPLISFLSPGSVSPCGDPLAFRLKPLKPFLLCPEMALTS